MSDCMPDDMKMAIDQFEKKIDIIIGSFLKTSDSDPPPDDIIYHYTDDSGLKGILEGKFWLTDIFNLNDPSELRHGCKFMIDRLNAASEKNGLKILKVLSDQFSSSIEKGIEDFASFFICSFSFASDDLGQWRAYGDNGQGFALGFDCRIFDDTIKRRADIATFRIKYEENQLLELYQRIIDELTPHVLLVDGRELANGVKFEYFKELYNYLYLGAVMSALHFKHEAYENECEYRLLHLQFFKSLCQIHYRSRPYSLIRYKEFDWKSCMPSALKKIVIGPAADKDKAYQFAKNCLQAFHKGNEDVSIKYSGIPYRAK